MPSTEQPNNVFAWLASMRNGVVERVTQEGKKKKHCNEGMLPENMRIVKHV